MNTSEIRDSDLYVEANKLRAEVAQLRQERDSILASLIAIGTGRVTHSYIGDCPDKLEGHDNRDGFCPACRMLMEAEGKL